MSNILHDIRKQYIFSSLDETKILSDPVEQFEVWLNEAIKCKEPEPTAMVLSTVDEHLQPHSRIVLLKEITPEGFVFYTNYEGGKAKQMEVNNRVSLLFFWPKMERQVRINGHVEKMSEAISTLYFLSRPLESRIGAWASPQSQVIRSKDFLEEQYKYYKKKFGENVPKPPFWGGYIVRPVSIEFWQGRPNRLHDRLIYTFGSGEWKISRLAP
jgi:pyridoxamine 5'-phosphate oxidase